MLCSGVPAAYGPAHLRCPVARGVGVPKTVFWITSDMQIVRLRPAGKAAPSASRRQATVASVLAAASLALVLAGCSDDPTSRVIPYTMKHGTVPPGTTVPETQKNGFPNLAYKAVTTHPVMMTQGEQQIYQGDLQKTLDAETGKATALASHQDTTAELTALGATHAEDARKIIESGTKPPEGAEPDADAGATN